MRSRCTLARRMQSAAHTGRSSDRGSPAPPAPRRRSPGRRRRPRRRTRSPCRRRRRRRGGRRRARNEASVGRGGPRPEAPPRGDRAVLRGQHARSVSIPDGHYLKIRRQIGRSGQVGAKPCGSAFHRTITGSWRPSPAPRWSPSPARGGRPTGRRGRTSARPGRAAGGRGRRPRRRPATRAAPRRCRRLGGVLAARRTVSPEQPVRPVAADLWCRAPLVVAVVPLAELVPHPRRGRPGPRAGTSREHAATGW